MTALRPEVAVVGRGLMGTACAYHLARAGHPVVLIGPEEPGDPATHDGPFGSFHDAGRITRRIAHDPVWATLSSRSIDRYAALEAESGISFFTPCGGMMAGPPDGAGAAFTRGFLDCAAALDLPHDRLAGAALAERFEMFRFAPGIEAAFDPAGGVIDPRAMRAAHEALARRGGARVIAQAVTERQGRDLRLADGSHVSAGHVVVATGAWSAAAPLTPRPAMRVFQRTIAFVEVAEEAARGLATMPSLIWVPPGQAHDLYLLPPLRYPDGRLWIKIGGEADSPEAEDAAALNAWFRGEGGVAAGAGLLAALRNLMHDLPMDSTQTGACAVSFTRTGYPYIAEVAPGVTLVTGGNGAGAKSADEIGRLAALKVAGADLRAEGHGTDFAAVLT